MQTYRSMGELPENCIAVPIASLKALPGQLFEDGDCLVVDATNREPEDGQYSLIRFGSIIQSLSLVETVFDERNGDRRWNLRIPGRFFWDCGYDHDQENASYLRNKIVGRVIGFLRLSGDGGDSWALEAQAMLSGTQPAQLAAPQLLDPFKCQIQAL